MEFCCPEAVLNIVHPSLKVAEAAGTTAILLKWTLKLVRSSNTRQQVCSNSGQSLVGCSLKLKHSYVKWPQLPRCGQDPCGLGLEGISTLPPGALYRLRSPQPAVNYVLKYLPGPDLICCQGQGSFDHLNVVPEPTRPFLSVFGSRQTLNRKSNVDLERSRVLVQLLGYRGRVGARRPRGTLQGSQGAPRSLLAVTDHNMTNERNPASILDLVLLHFILMAAHMMNTLKQSLSLCHDHAPHPRAGIQKVNPS